MTHPVPHRRRWFGFSLRTLFVLVTVLGVFLGWVDVQLKWIRDRHEARSHHDALWTVYSTPIGPWQPQAPWRVRIFGESGTATIYLRDEKSDAELQRIETLFPEASVWIPDG